MIRDRKTMKIIEITLPCDGCKQDAKFVRQGNYFACTICGSLLYSRADLG
jgi:rRNA maturation endonuclease Nob1